MFGLRIIEDVNRVVPYEDWSGVRSPGRARRRRWKHKQRIVIRYKPDPTVIKFADALVMHPETARQIRAALTAQEPRHGRD